MVSGARVAAVHRFDALSDAPVEAFDRVTYLATRLLRTPVAYISMVHADRKEIRSARGLGGTLPDVARNEALCAIPVLTGRPVCVADVHEDARTAGNPLLVADAGLRAYAGAPLVTHDGLSIGALAVFDRVPREFDATELQDLADLAALIMRELELRLAARRAVLAR